MDRITTERLDDLFARYSSPEARWSVDCRLRVMRRALRCKYRNHPRAPRLPRSALFNRFLGCLYYCLQTGQTYAEDQAFLAVQPIAA